jgi:hypothetical protein
MATPDNTDDQEFYDALVNAANAEPDTYIHEDGSELEVVADANLERIYNYNDHRQAQEQAFRRLLGG